MKRQNPFAFLSRFELCLWLFSLAVVAISFFFLPEKDYLSLIASLVGVTALIFVAKGMVFGQILTVLFAVLYGIISFHFRYYGEMITYLCMSAPAAILAVISWIRHPYRQSEEVRVNRSMPLWQILLMILATLAVTVAFYFILGALNTANLLFSTVSVTTSFLASFLTWVRSPWYALAYAANDVVLIILWILAALVQPAYIAMVLCFLMFLLNDIYGFVNWRRMQRRQSDPE